MKEDEPLREPVVTGVMRLEIHGDRERGMAFSHRARAQLGLMLNYHGVPERIAAGEPGGFFHSNHTYAGGVRIQTITNNGQHTARIFVPPLPKPTVEEEEEEVKEEPRKKPYMWVGVRVNYAAPGPVPSYAPMPFIIEPDNPDAVGIVHNAFGSGAFVNWFGVDVTSEGDVSLNADFAGETVDTLIAALDAELQVPDRSQGKEYKHHNLALIIYTETPQSDQGAGLYFSKNGLRLYDNITFAENFGPSRWRPYDPEMTDEENAGEGRDFTGKERTGTVAPDTGWDQVFVLDPFEEDGVDPVDDRVHIVKMRRFLESLGMESDDAQVLDGTYLFGIGAFGQNFLISNRAGEPIPGFDPTFFLRSADGDYQEYLTVGDWAPMEVEVEVRLGKPNTKVFNFTLTCQSYDDRIGNVSPFGWEDSYDECLRWGGPNPFGANYSPELIAIDVLGESAELVTTVPVPIFGGGIYEPDGAFRSPVDIYIFGDTPALTQVDQADYAEHAAYAIFQTLEGMTAGVYGLSVLYERSQSDIFGAVAGIQKGFVWRYDVVSNTITQLPVISDIGDYDYGDGYHQSHLYWYYPYLSESRYACHNVFALVIQNTMTFIYEASQSLAPGMPAPDCC